MRHYQFRFPPGLIIPGILGVLLLTIVVSIGLLLFGIVLAALVVIGIGSAIYRALFRRDRHRIGNLPGIICVKTGTKAGSSA